MGSERSRCQAQGADPALGAFVEPGDTGIRQRDPGTLEQVARLLEQKAAVGGPELGQCARETQPVQPELRRGAREQYDAKLRRQTSQEALDLRLRLDRVHALPIVY